MHWRYCSLKAIPIAVTFSFQICIEMRNGTMEGSFMLAFFKLQMMFFHFSFSYSYMGKNFSSLLHSPLTSNAQVAILHELLQKKKFTIRKPTCRILKLQVTIEGRDLEKFMQKYFFFHWKYNFRLICRARCHLSQTSSTYKDSLLKSLCVTAPARI